MFLVRNTMVKKLPLGSSWQILFLRCLIQVFSTKEQSFPPLTIIDMRYFFVIKPGNQTFHQPRQHCRLTLWKYDFWNKRNTHNHQRVSEQKIQIIILILKRGPCLLQAGQVGGGSPGDKDCVDGGDDFIVICICEYVGTPLCWKRYFRFVQYTCTYGSVSAGREFWLFSVTFF